MAAKYYNIMFIGAIVIIIYSAMITMAHSQAADQCSIKHDDDGQCTAPPPDDSGRNSKGGKRRHDNINIKTSKGDGVRIEQSTRDLNADQFAKLKSNLESNKKFRSNDDHVNSRGVRVEDELHKSWENGKTAKVTDDKMKGEAKSKKRPEKSKEGNDANSRMREDMSNDERERRTENLRRDLEELEKTERELRAKGHFKYEDGDTPEKERNCPPHLFECGSKECILPTSKCDNEEDCADGSDEVGCPKGGDPQWKCPHNLFTCKNKECILQHYRCDGRKNCSDGSDEKNCDEKTIEEKKKWNAKFAKLNQGKQRRRPNWDEL